MSRLEVLQEIANKMPRRYPQVHKGWVYVKPQVEFICFEDKDNERAFYIKTLDKPISELQAYIDQSVREKMAYGGKAFIYNEDIELVKGV